MKIRFETTRRMELIEFHSLELEPDDLKDRTLDQAIAEAIAEDRTEVYDTRNGDLMAGREIQFDTIEEQT